MLRKTFAQALQGSKGQILGRKLTFSKISSSSSPAHLFAIRGKRKRGPGTLQTRDQNLPE